MLEIIRKATITAEIAYINFIVKQVKHKDAFGTQKVLFLELHMEVDIFILYICEDYRNMYSITNIKK